jgi:serine/threonine protein kinase
MRLLLRASGQSYTVRDGIGQGAHHQVRLGVSDAGQSVAVKLNHDRRAAAGDRFDFEHELLSTAGSRTRSLPKSYGIGTDASGRRALVMERVEGSKLLSWEAVNKPRPIGLCLAIATRILRATEEINASGYVHNDLHPENVMINASDPETVRVLDFENARPIGERYKSQGNHRYLAPEARANSVGPGGGTNADVYTVAYDIYSMATGRFPDRDGPGLADDVPDVSRPGHPVTLRQVLRTALETDPAKRYGNATAFRRALKPFLDL